MNLSFDQDNARKILSEKRRELGRGLSYTEKILFLHEMNPENTKKLKPGIDQIFLRPDRVAMQDATAQMAMLQFMQTGQKKTHVSATIHCDHLIRASEGSTVDLQKALGANKEVYDFLSSAAMKYGIGFWGPGSGIIHQVLLENYAVPGGLMIGTDSHTPNAGWTGDDRHRRGRCRRSGSHGRTAMGNHIPSHRGGQISRGKLTGWASAKDIILEMLNRFTVKGGNR